ncbi:galanin peptides isoform X1 [Petromyzon marinus]|uniref:Galanin n=1 Tax=Petromyzon marinus TaxID=7757 RepID=A0A5J6VX42_PETMA|nr:galanin peptides isoform X1 [Petromyzon marinus]QFH23055.1 galanin [Petromyzon marinus]
MQCSPRLLICLALLVLAAIAESHGMVLTEKEKRGWTLNSAGYLLGPTAMDQHRTLNGLAGKRAAFEETFNTFGQKPLRVSTEDVLRAIIDYLNYMHMKEARGLSTMPEDFFEDLPRQP